MTNQEDSAGAARGMLWTLANRPAQTLSLPDQVAIWIGEQIITGNLAPGARLTEQPAAEHFGISRAPVREAFRILEQQHLLELLPRRGARVSGLTTADVRDLSDLRAALYRVIAERLAGKGDPDAIARLEAKADALQAAAEDPSGPDSYLRGALELSLAMARETGSPRMTGILEQLALQTYRYARLSALTAPQRHKAARMWRDAVRAMKRLDGEGAARILTRIAEFARDEAIRALAVNPPARVSEGNTVA